MSRLLPMISVVVIVFYAIEFGFGNSKRTSGLTNIERSISI